MRVVREAIRFSAERQGHPDAPHVDARKMPGLAMRGGAARAFRPGSGLGNMDISREASVLGTFSVWRAAAPRRFWFDNFYWSVAPFDLYITEGWNWNGDDLVIYDDPIIRAGISPTIRGWAPMPTSNIWVTNMQLREERIRQRAYELYLDPSPGAGAAALKTGCGPRTK